MPGMDGFQVMEGLKAIETGGYLPVLVLTAQPDHKLRALKAGARDFLSKPFDLAEVVVRVHNMLEVRLLHMEAENAATERNSREQALHESQYLIEGILNAMPVRVFWKDENLNYLGCNAVFARDAGFADPKDIIGKDDYQMGWRDQAELYRSDDRQVIESGCSKFLIEESQTTPEGKTITLLSSKVPLRNSEGEISGVLGTYMDITERKKAEAHLLLQVRALEAAANAIVITDTKGVIEWANPAFTAFTGYSAAEALGKTPRLLKSGKHDDKFYQSLWETILAGKTWHGELINRRKDGTLYEEEMTITPMRGINGKIAHFIAIKQDITKRKMEEEQLLWKTAFLEAQVNSSLDGILILNNEGKKILQNQRMIDLWNIPVEIADEADDQRQREWVISQVKNPPQFAGEVAELDAHPDEISHSDVELADGRIFERYSSPVRGMDGKHYGRIRTYRDITERKREEENLRRFATVVRDSNDAITIQDFNGRITAWNRGAELMYGYGEKEALLMNIERLTASDKVAEQKEFIRRLIAGEAITSFETRRVTKDGRVLNVWMTVTKLLGEAGNPIGLASTERDITERKRAGEQIAEQASLLDHARGAILVRDLDGKFLYWNKGAERMYGWMSQEAVGRTVLEIHRTDPKKFEEINKLVISQGEWNGEILHLAKDGREITCDLNCTLIRDDEGRPKSILVISTDITEKKKLEAQFMRAQRMESIGTLAGGIAHDLNNILAPIMMSIELLKETASDPQSTKMLETIEVSAKRGADIVRQVLSFARGMEGEKIEVQPKHLLKDLESIIKNTFPKDIRLQFSIPNDTWTILGDPTQVHQVLLNLCVNARDAMPNGGTLTIGVENCVIDEQYAAMNLQAKPGCYVKISVTDSGTGIPPEILDRIFDPFFTTKELGKGTGLGLSMVMTIVKSHEGFINVYSEPGKGTTFKVYLPATELSSEARMIQMQSLSPPRGNGETILVLDDEASILAITSQTLQAFGYRVLTATNGANGMVVYAKHKNEIAVVLTDMAMPIMDGPATIHSLMQINPAVKIIAASGLNANGGVAKASSFGVKHFLTKPFTTGTLLKTLRTVLDET
jgi:PAS domain S-box-containing protein